MSRAFLLMITNLLMFSSLSFSQEIVRLKSEREILNLRKKAIVQVVIKVEGGSYTGSGFFVSKNKIITNHHTIKHFQKDPKSKIAFIHNGELIMDLNMGQCGDENFIDLCVFKTTNYKSKYYIPANSYEKSFVNESVTVLGWPDRVKSPINYNYKIKKIWKNQKEESGLIDYMKRRNITKNLKMPSIQLNGVTEEGMSGGPSFNPSNGKFKGVTGDIYVVSKTEKYDLLIPSSFVFRFVKNNTNFKEVDYKRMLQSYKSYKGSMKSLSETERMILDSI